MGAKPAEDETLGSEDQECCDIDIDIPYVRHMFLSVLPERLAPLPVRRCQSVPVASTCDRYTREVHVLMFKPTGLPRSCQVSAETPSTYNAPCKPAEMLDDTISVATATPTTREGDAGFALRQCLTGSDASSTAASEGESVHECDFSSSPLDDGLSHFQEEEAEGASEKEAMLSIGSRKHASGDCRPCAYIGSKQRPCLNGVDCLFCHIPHTAKRRIRLCRRKRLEMRDSVSSAVVDAGIEGVNPAPRYVPIACPVTAVKWQPSLRHMTKMDG